MKNEKKKLTKHFLGYTEITNLSTATWNDNVKHGYIWVNVDILFLLHGMIPLNACKIWNEPLKFDRNAI